MVTTAAREKPEPLETNNPPYELRPGVKPNGVIQRESPVLLIMKETGQVEFTHCS